MATVHILPLSIRLPEFTAGAKNQRNFTTFTAKKRPISISFAVNSPESAPEAPDKVEIELEFIGPKPGDDGEYPIERARAVSGEKLLRNIMLDNKIELYAPYGKVMNCGGGGSCGTCIVEIIDGQDLLNERTNTELRYLKKWHSLSTRGSSLGKGICGRGCTGFGKRVKVLLQPYAVEPNLHRNTTKSSRTKPESWRLACQTIVGNKENSGKVRVQRLPQWKK